MSDVSEANKGGGSGDGGKEKKGKDKSKDKEKKRVKKEQEKKTTDGSGKDKNSDSPFFKAKKNIAGKAATSKLGKSILKKVMDDESNNLMRALKRTVELRTDQKKAKEIQNNIIKLFLKAHFQIEKKVLTPEQFAVADRPLRKTFRRIIKINESYEKLQKDEELLKTNFLKIETYLKEIESIILGLLNPYITEKNRKRLSDTVLFLSRIDFLTAVWADPQSKEPLQKLTTAMAHYLKTPSQAPPIVKTTSTTTTTS